MLACLALDAEHAVFPDYALYSVAIGAAIYSSKDEHTFEYSELIKVVEEAANMPGDVKRSKALFESDADYKKFKERHSGAKVTESDIAAYS